MNPTPNKPIRRDYTSSVFEHEPGTYLYDIIHEEDKPMIKIEMITLTPKQLSFIPPGWTMIDAHIYQGNLEITIEEKSKK